jgi:hypothetical protein
MTASIIVTVVLWPYIVTSQQHDCELDVSTCAPESCMQVLSDVEARCPVIAQQLATVA